MKPLAPVAGPCLRECDGTASVDSGTYKDNIGKTTIKATCNDSQGFSIYAIGYTNEEYGNTVLKPTTLDSPQNDIATGTATNGDTSNWAMKLTAGNGMSSTNILSDPNQINLPLCAKYR